MSRTRSYNSIASRVDRMEVGDRIWVETTPGGYQQVMREWNVPFTRRTEASRDFVITTTLFQATRIAKLDAPVTLVMVERVK